MKPETDIFASLHVHPIRRAAVVLFAGTLLAACHGGALEGQPQSPAQNTATLVVKSQLATAYAATPGTVISLKRAEISSRLTGYVRRVDVQAGDTVRAGQHLLSIDSSDVTGTLQQAQAGVNQAQAVYDEANINFQRYQTLFPQGAVSRMQLDEAQRQYATSKAQLHAAQAALRMATAAIGYADVTAPFAGVVVEKLVDAGDLATPGKPLLVVEDEHTLEVQCYVPDDIYARLHAGQQIPFTASGEAYMGSLKSAVSAADPQTHTHLIRLGIVSGSGLTSGMYVRVHLPVGEQTMVRIPTEAVTERAGITGVFVVNADSYANFRMVRTGDLSGGQVEILSGLADGERIVLHPDASIDNGTRIAVAVGDAR
ncbi:MAG: efflux RND transporter periplasmic adaptor subunit [Gammaproteobacteria bacterium]|nr:efflux RND transporter periplasmic adaptor subunit [Gammaproteobacteria bacterium]MDE2346427.1 efflux RND transporter periplasmic adaptor subunit [Gammaproteobacteria bacterium]